MLLPVLFLLQARLRLLMLVLMTGNGNGNVRLIVTVTVTVIVIGVWCMRKISTFLCIDLYFFLLFLHIGNGLGVGVLC